MKKLSLFRVEFWWQLEKISGRLWNWVTPEDEVTSWFDSVPAFVYVKRKNAEHYHYRTFNENIYGQSI